MDEFINKLKNYSVEELLNQQDQMRKYLNKIIDNEITGVKIIIVCAMMMQIEEEIKRRYGE